MKYTLLEMVQLILSAMDSDEVNDIADTVESNQVATLLKSVYYDCATDLNLHEHEDLIQLEPSLDNAKPCLMYAPSTVTRIDWIKYDNASIDYPGTGNYQYVTYLPLSQFLEYTENLSNADQTNQSSMIVNDNEGNDYTFYFQNDRAPSYYTHFRNSVILFDAYNSDEDTTLQKSKTLCFGAKYPGWTMTNTFIPDLDPTQFSYLINRAKTRAFVELKQQANPDASGEARRQKIVIQKRKRKLPMGSEFDRLPKFGRTGPYLNSPFYSKILRGND